MTSISDAEAQLTAAVERLESAASKPRAAVAPARVAELEAEIKRLRQDHAALQVTVELVTARLDSAITRLRATLVD
jgi:hypothetical protein